MSKLGMVLGAAGRCALARHVGVPSLCLLCAVGVAAESVPSGAAAASIATVLIQGNRDQAGPEPGPLISQLAPFQSTTIVTEGDLALWAPRRLEDLVGLLPGTVVEPLNAGLSTAVKVRGFAVTRVHFGGLPDIQRMFVRDPITVERLETLRGPGAALFGITSPGGVINYVGKPATGEDHTVIGLAGGSHRFGRATVDHGGQIAAALSYRLVGAVEDGTRSLAELPLRRQTGMLLLAHRYEAGEFGIDLHAQHNASPFSFGTVITNGGVPGSPALPASVAWDRLLVLEGGAPAERRYRDATARWIHDLGLGMSINAVVSAARVSRDEELIGYWTLRSPTTVSSYYTDYRDKYRQLSGRLETQARVSLGSTRHELSIGLDAYRQHFLFQGVQNIGALTTSIDSPDFSALPISGMTLSQRYNDEKIVEEGQWLSDRIELSNRLTLTAALRRQRYAIESDRVGTGRRLVARSAATTWFGGAEWHMTSGIRSWLSVASGMEPNRGATVGGDFLPPQESRQLELGFERHGKTHRTSIALWRIHLDNVAMTDPTDRTAVIAAGQRRVQGVEVLAAKQIRAWKLAANATIQETRHLTKTSASLGARFVGVPNVSGGMQLSGPVPLREYRATANVGLVAIGSRMGDAANTVRVPGYVRVDGGLALEFERAKLSFGIRNAFDLRYVESVTATDDVFQGGRREWWLGLSLRP